MALVSGFISKVFWGTMREESQSKRGRWGVEMINDLVICLPAYIITALINFLMYTDLLMDAVSRDSGPDQEPRLCWRLNSSAEEGVQG